MSTKSSKRILLEAAELASDPSTDYHAAPLEDDIFEWHCTVRGAPNTDFEGGLYHLRILLPPNYPFTAPDIMLLTPSGRFEVGKKICIDGLTSFHAGSWQPAWGVRTAIVGLISFWNMKGEALQAIGAIDQPPEERRRLAKLSREWCCPTCAESNSCILPDPPAALPIASTSSSSLSAPEKTAPISFPDSSPTSASAPTSTPSTPTPTDIAPNASPLSSSSSPSPATASSPPPTTLPPPSSDPSPPPDAHSAPEAPPLPVAASQPYGALREASARPPAAPIWFDALFGLAIAALVVVLARKML